MQRPPLLNVEALRRLLDTRSFGVADRLLYLPTVESTNTLTVRLAQDESPEGLVVLTDNQTAGKGRQGRRWVDLPGCNALSSILLRPLFPPHLLVMVASLAVVDAIADTCSLAASIKWPNDVLIGEHKVAGILIETTHDRGGQLVAALGIGVNVNGRIQDLAQQLPGSVPLSSTATTLETVSGQAINRELFIARLLHHCENAYLTLQQEATTTMVVDSSLSGPASRLIRERWRGRLSTLGRTISVHQGGAILHGVAEEVDDNGELLLRCQSGQLVRITWGVVEHFPGKRLSQSVGDR